MARIIFENTTDYQDYATFLGDVFEVNKDYTFLEWLRILEKPTIKIIINSWDTFPKKLDNEERVILTYLASRDGYFTIYDRKDGALDNMMMARQVYMPVLLKKDKKTL